MCAIVSSVGTWDIENLFRPGGVFGPGTRQGYRGPAGGAQNEDGGRSPEVLAVEKIGELAAPGDLVALQTGERHRALSRRWCKIFAALGALAVALSLPTAVRARPYLPAPRKVFVGLTGGTSILPFEQMVGKHPPVFETFMTWNTPTAWLANPDPAFRSRAALHLSTAPGYAKPGVISPRQIARGRSDRFLLELNRNLTLSGRIFYIRVMGEPNGYWNAHAPYNRDGTFRGVQNAPRFYRQAWRRTVLILRGGPTTVINRRLRALGLPRLQVRPTSHCSSKSSHAVPRATRCQPVLPRPKVAFLWVPQDAGSPDIAANAPSVVWPGGAYVDWVGTDFYASYLWRSTCGVMFFSRSEGQRLAAAAAYLVSRRASASRVSAVPARVGNSGSSSLPPRSDSQALSVVTVALVRGVIRCRRPFPSVLMCAPAPSRTSASLRVTSSAARSPVCAASIRIA